MRGCSLVGYCLSEERERGKEGRKGDGDGGTVGVN